MHSLHPFCVWFYGGGSLNKKFKACIKYLSSQNGWFVPAGKLLDFLCNNKTTDYATSGYLNKLDAKWIIDRLIKKLRFGR